jgi:hypothetical protein
MLTSEQSLHEIVEVLFLTAHLMPLALSYLSTSASSPCTPVSKNFAHFGQYLQSPLQHELAANISIYYLCMGAGIFVLERRLHEGELRKGRYVWNLTLTVVSLETLWHHVGFNLLSVDQTQALDRALDHEYDVNQPQR